MVRHKKKVTDAIGTAHRRGFIGVHSGTRNFLEGVDMVKIAAMRKGDNCKLGHSARLLRLGMVHDLGGSRRGQISVMSAFLKTRTLPPRCAKQRSRCVSFLVRRVLPVVQRGRLTRYYSIFYRRKIFSVRRSHHLLATTHSRNFLLGLRTSRVISLKKTRLTTRLGTLSTSRLLRTSSANVHTVTRTKIMTALLPLATFTLGRPCTHTHSVLSTNYTITLTASLGPNDYFSNSVPLAFTLTYVCVNFAVRRTVATLALGKTTTLGHTSHVNDVRINGRNSFIILSSASCGVLPCCVNVGYIGAAVGENILCPMIW